MPAITLDPDIAAASTTLALERINCQHYRNALDAQRLHQAALIANEQETIGLAGLQHSQRGTELSLREQVTLAIAAKYMTTGPATVPESVALDAENDARRLKAAVDAVLATLP